MADEKNAFQDVFGDPKPPSNPAEQNPTLNMPEKSPQQNLVDQFSVGMKPARSDSSSETFVADAAESIRHDQAQRIQESGGDPSKLQSSDAPGDEKLRSGDKDEFNSVVLGGQGDPNLRSATNPGGLTDLSPEGIRESTETSQIRQLGVAESESNSNQEFVAYIGGRQKVVNKETFEKYQTLMKEMGDAQRNRTIDAIPQSDPYWSKANELESFVTSI